MFWRRKWLWIALLSVVLAGAGGYYFFFYSRTHAQSSSSQTATLQTARVRQGDLVLSATGAGTIVAADEMEVGFSGGGLLTEINVQVGDQVKEGDVLARIDDLDARRTLASADLQVSKAQFELETAKQSLAELQKASSEADLAEDQAAVKSAEAELAELQQGATKAEISNAEATLATAQETLNKLINGPSAEELEQAKLKVSQAKNSLWSAQMSRDARQTKTERDAAQPGVLNAEIAVQLAEMELADLQKPATEAEIKKARADVATAQEQLDKLRQGATEAELAEAEAKLAKAKETLQELQEGPSADEVAAAEEAVHQAELSLASAQLVLEGAQRDLKAVTLTAPFDGTVMAVNGHVGENAGTGSLITLADLSTPLLEVYLDEADMGMLSVGYEVEIVLDALPDVTLKGQVVQVDPQLTTASGTQVLRGVVALDSSTSTTSQRLIPGLNATIDVISARATGALLVPVEALRDLGDGEYAVFVVEDGQPKLRTVVVGLQDETYAEIKSGLELGETVSTGMLETK